MILPVRRKRDSFLPWLQLLVDAITIYAALNGVFWFRFKSGYFENTISPQDYYNYHAAFAFIFIVLVFFLRFFKLYKPAKHFTFAQESLYVIKAVASATFVITALTFFFRGFSFSRSYLAICGIVLALGICLARLILGYFIMKVDDARKSHRNILIIGYDEHSKKIIRFYEKNPRLSTKVVAFVDSRYPKNTLLEKLPVLGGIDEITEILRHERQIHEVILAPCGLGNEEVLKIIYECEKNMVAFHWVTDIFGLIASKMTVSNLGPVPVLSFTDSPLVDWENRFLKRALDVSLSGLALVLLSPFFLIVAFLIRKDSPGPVLYKQERVGEDGKKFDVLKFRTMRVNAEKETGPVWAKENDSRRTALGTFLRRNNLDELPQLWNVLVGNMSLVGPRPERPFFVAQFKEDIPRYMARHSIRSGITGWAQVNGLRGNTSIEERTKFDLYYIENWSLFFDIKILFMTLFARKNAY